MPFDGHFSVCQVDYAYGRDPDAICFRLGLDDWVTLLPLRRMCCAYMVLKIEFETIQDGAHKSFAVHTGHTAHAVIPIDRRPG